MERRNSLEEGPDALPINNPSGGVRRDNQSTSDRQLTRTELTMRVRSPADQQASPVHRHLDEASVGADDGQRRRRGFVTI